MLTRKVRIDLDPNSALAVVNCNQYDEIADCLEISLFKNSQAFNIPSGASVKIQGTKPDMHGFQYDAKSFSGNTVVCDLTQQMTAVAGEVPTEIRIFDTSENTAHSANFILQVEESALSDDTIMSDTEISGVETLKEIVERLDDVTQDVAKAETAAHNAQLYSTSAGESAELAAQNATSAASSASEANASKEAAAQSAEAAATSETNAKSSEQTAATKANEASASAATANTKANESANSAEESEAWATGKKNGVDVESTEAQYHNNSKYYAEQASSAASGAVAAAEAELENYIQDAEAWAVGQRGGTDVPSDDETYHNNAKYYAEQAGAAAAGGVSSFNARSGHVVPKLGDYDANLIGYETVGGTTKTVKQKIDEVDSASVKWSERKGYVGKNLLENKATSQTINGITFTVNDDGSVTINGTATNRATLFIQGNAYNASGGVDFESGTFIISGSDNGSQSTYFFETGWYSSDGSFDMQRVYSGKESATITISEGRKLVSAIVVVSGASVDNQTVYPMLRHASITDDTYEEYLPPNDKIATKAFSDVSWEEQNYYGAKQILPMPWAGTDCKEVGVEKTKNGITYVVNEDYSITLLSGTATANTWIVVIDRNNGVACFKEGVEYILSGRYGNFSLYIADANNSVKAAVTAAGAESKFIGFNGNMSLNINIPNGSTIDEAQTYKPMVRLASIKDPTYAPYAMTNRELTEKVQEGGGGSSVNVIDNLTSTSATDALSANQGKVLNDSVGTRVITKIGGYIHNNEYEISVDSTANTAAVKFKEGLSLYGTGKRPLELTCEITAAYTNPRFGNEVSRDFVLSAILPELIDYAEDGRNYPGVFNLADKAIMSLDGYDYYEIIVVPNGIVRSQTDSNDNATGAFEFIFPKFCIILNGTTATPTAFKITQIKKNDMILKYHKQSNYWIT